MPLRGLIDSSTVSKGFVGFDGGFGIRVDNNLPRRGKDHGESDNGVELRLVAGPSPMEGPRPAGDPQGGGPVHAQEPAIIIVKGFPVLIEIVVVEDGSPRCAARGAIFSNPGAVSVGIDLTVRERFPPDPIEEGREGSRGAIDRGISGGSIRR